MENVIYKEIKGHVNIAVFGAMRSGKTRLVNLLCEKIYRYYDVVLVCSPYNNNEILNNKKIKNVHYLPCNDQSVKEYVELCEKNNNLGFRSLIIFDDVISTLSFKGKASNYMKKLGSSGRHCNISTIWLLQNFTDTLPSVLKGSLDFMFFFYRIPFGQFESIYGYFPMSDEWRNAPEFYSIYLKRLAKYEFLFIDKSDVKENAFIFCLPLENEFRIREKPRELTDEERRLIEFRELFRRRGEQGEPNKSRISGPDNRALLSKLQKKK